MGNLISTLFATSDEQLMERVRAHDDPEAFARLVARWQPPIQRLCARMTGDPHRAEDLVQIAFSRVFARRAEWQPKARFSSFLWRIAINLCHDDLRRLRSRAEIPLDDLEAEPAPHSAGFVPRTLRPDAEADLRERGEIVREAVLKLAPLYREVIVLRHYQDLKFREIAETLGIPEGTAKSRMAEALTQLNLLLKHLNENTSCNRKSQTFETPILA